jgi:hypothetical protein
MESKRKSKIRILSGAFMKSLNVIITFLIFVCFFLQWNLLAFGKRGEEQNIQFKQNSSFRLYNTMLHINDFSAWIRNDGKSARSPSGAAGCWYPRGTGSAIFQDGLIWGGYTRQPGTPQRLRVGGQKYQIGTVPGRIISTGIPEDPSLPHVRVYRIRPDYLSVPDHELIPEVAELFYEGDYIPVTQADIDSVRRQYEIDWNEWPTQYGAPFYDLNNNGIYEPALGEKPGLLDAHQVIWFVCNDAYAPALAGSKPLGLELQVTLWAYKGTTTALDHAMFRRYRLLNKSEFTIDSMFIGQFSDPDIGTYTDDYAGCDSLLELGYCYNGLPSDVIFQAFNLPPPAVGYTLLQGPIVPSPGDVAIFKQKEKAGYRNLPMRSFYYHHPRDVWPEWNEYSLTLIYYNILNGFRATSDTLNPTPYVHGTGPESGRVTRFPLNGDPYYLTGDIDGQGNNFGPGDRRIALSSGPFKMEPGDTQEVIYGVVGAVIPEGNYLHSVAQLKLNIESVRWFASHILTKITEDGKTERVSSFRLYQNHPNPFNAGTTFRYWIPAQAKVKLEVYSILGQRVATLVDKEQAQGEYFVRWQPQDVASGMYIYRLDAGSNVEVKKMLLIK